MRKRTKHETTWSPPFSYDTNENGRRRLLGAQSINTERVSLKVAYFAPLFLFYCFFAGRKREARPSFPSVLSTVPFRSSPSVCWVCLAEVQRPAGSVSASRRDSWWFARGDKDKLWHKIRRSCSGGWKTTGTSGTVPQPTSALQVLQVKAALFFGLGNKPVSRSCAVAKSGIFWRATGQSNSADRIKNCSTGQGAVVWVRKPNFGSFWCGQSFVYQVWLPSVPPEFSTFSYCAWLWNWFIDLYHGIAALLKFDQTQY